ncbi:hypothetical protein OIU85_005672 [Salix viminalis]|uniref:Uncharacterized protein n=1 Tax=Salix viminalis TaxID=40686 RepID=A0A9Q0PJG1_SALVM|nr:hypothetical protein OIU85_005672 [Salix viminalis]
MDEPFFDIMEFLKKPSMTETLVDILLCAVPIWLAVTIGLVIGWSWRPRWTGLVFLGLRSKFRFLWTAPPGFGARRLWLAFTAISALSVCRTIWSSFNGQKIKNQHPPLRLQLRQPRRGIQGIEVAVLLVMKCASLRSLRPTYHDCAVAYKFRGIRVPLATALNCYGKCNVME